MHLLLACTAASRASLPHVSLVLAPPAPAAAPQDFVTQRLQAMPGVGLEAPQGAFYVMPEVSAFVGPGVEARGFGPVPDVDTLCRCAVRQLVGR